MSFFHKALEIVGGKRKINPPEPEIEFVQAKQHQQHKDLRIRVEKVTNSPQKNNYRPKNTDYRNRKNSNNNNQPSSQKNFQPQHQPLRNFQAQTPKNLATIAPERIQHDITTENLKDPEIIMKELRDFRAKTSRDEKIKPYFVFDNQQLDELVEKVPRTKEELHGIHGFVPKKIEKYGDEIIRILNG